MTIIPDTNSMYTEDGAWVKDDDEREAALSPAYACLGCHNNDPDDGIPDKTLAQAAAQAKDMHEATFISQQTDIVLNVYPNPSVGPMKINFTLMSSQDISVNIYNASGQTVYTMSEVNLPNGTIAVDWDGRSNTGMDVKAGYYFVKVTAGTLTSVQKVVIMN